MEQETMISKCDSNTKKVRSGLFGIDYDTWCCVVDSFVETAYAMKSKKVVQLYSLCKLERSSVMALRSEEFFYKYIENGAIALFDLFWFKSHYYAERNDGGLRDVAQISPLMFFVLESIGMTLYKLNKTQDNPNIASFYSGDYGSLSLHFTNQYGLFKNELNKYVGKRHYLKTDIRNFYHSIDLNDIIDRIKKIDSDNTLSPMTLAIYEEIFRYLGNGRFPLVNMSVTMSYMAVKILSDEIDKRLSNKLSEFKEIKEYSLIRYEDDMYIVFSLHDESDENIKDMSLRILWNYSSILSEYGLTLNMDKCKLLNDSHPQQGWNKSDYQSSQESKNLDSGECFTALLKHLTNVNEWCVSPDGIKEFVANYCDNHEDNPTHLLNGILYSREPYSEESISLLNDLIINKFDLISIEPTLITNLIIKTGNTSLINNFLNKLHEQSMKKDWTTYYSIAATTYLMENEFKKSDLENILYTDNLYYKYCSLFCVDDFYLRLINEPENKMLNLMNSRLSFLYSMYMIRSYCNKQLSAFAFYSAFFEKLSKRFMNNNDSNHNTGSNFDYEAYLSLYGENESDDNPLTRVLKLKNINNNSPEDMESMYNSMSDKEINEITNDLKSILEKMVNRYIDKEKNESR